MLTVDVESDWGSDEVRGIRTVLPRLLELLDTHRARVTFFVVGNLAAEVREVLDPGSRHEIGSHGMTHRLLTRLSEEQIVAEIAQSRAALQRQGFDVIGFRAPFLRAPRTLPALLATAGYRYDSSLGSVVPSLRNVRRRNAAVRVTDGVARLNPSTLRDRLTPFSLTYLRLLHPLGLRMQSPAASLVLLPSARVSRRSRWLVRPAVATATVARPQLRRPRVADLRATTAGLPRPDGHLPRTHRGARVSEDRHVVIGAGPAGLTAAWQLALRDQRVLILETDPDSVGGLARTVRYRGHGFDIGPHRFYTKSEEVHAMRRRMLPDDFVEVDRLTRIYYEGKFYAYPIALGETLRNLGLRRSLRVGASYARARLLPARRVASFEDWVVQRFGNELYRTFFKTYTEKVWGVPCSEIDKDWAAQRIRGLSLFAAVRNAVLGPSRNGVKSLVERFHYPREGAGQLWDAALAAVRAAGNRCELGAEVVRLDRDGDRVVAATTADGRRFEGGAFYSTMTLRALLRAMRPAPPDEVLAAGDSLRHRDFIVVALLVDDHRPVSRPVDLRARPRRARRADHQLRELEPGPHRRTAADTSGTRVLLRPRPRVLAALRRGHHRDRPRRTADDRVGAHGCPRRRLRRADHRRLPGVRPRLRRQPRDRQTVAERGVRQLVPGGAPRTAQLQQPRPRDDVGRDVRL